MRARAPTRAGSIQLTYIRKYRLYFPLRYKVGVYYYYFSPFSFRFVHALRAKQPCGLSFSTVIVEWENCADKGHGCRSAPSIDAKKASPGSWGGSGGSWRDVLRRPADGSGATFGSVKKVRYLLQGRRLRRADRSRASQSFCVRTRARDLFTRTRAACTSSIYSSGRSCAKRSALASERRARASL